MKLKIRFDFPEEKADDFYEWIDTHPKFVDVFIGKI